MKNIYEKALLNYKPHSIIKFKTSNKLALIVDPRYDALMDGVINNFASHLNPEGWNFLIVSLAKHREAIQAKYSMALFMAIPETLVVNNNLTIDAYNWLLTNSQFWQSLNAEHILVFQKDCYMYKMFDESKYLAYDYAGANFFNPMDCNPLIGGINGGCSLRTRSAMLDCLKYVSWELIEHVRYNEAKLISGLNTSILNKHEDVFFTHACAILHKNVLPLNERSEFSIEADFNMKTCFYHGWHHNYQSLEQALYMLQGNYVPSDTLLSVR